MRHESPWSRAALQRAAVSASGRALCAAWIIAVCLSPAGAADSTAIRVSANGRYFLDGNGKPFLYFGDTEWDIWQEVTLEGSKAIIDDRHAKGFNEFNVRLVGTSDGLTANKYGQKPFLSNNPATPNPAYFAAVDSVVHMCRRAGIVLVIGIHHKGFWGPLINAGNARPLAAWLGARYRNDPNVVWCVSYADEMPEYTPIVDSIFAGIRATDISTRLTTRHPDPYYTDPSFYAQWKDKIWLSFYSTQTNSEDNSIPALFRGLWVLTPAKPAVEAEAHYEDDGGTTPYDIRKQTWWTYLSGGFYTYGHTDNWQNVTNYAVWLGAPGNVQCVYARSFLVTIDWWTLVPDQTIISGTAGQNCAARSSTGAWILAYLPSAGSVTINMSKISVGTTVNASWYKPIDGSTQAITGALANTGAHAFTAPSGWQDAVLYLRTTQPTSVRVSTWPAAKPSAASTKRLVVVKDRAGISITAGGRSVDPAGASLPHSAVNPRGQRVDLK